MPHLVAGRGTDDDRVLRAEEVTALLARPVVVEEKLDGANVMLWLAGSIVDAALRSGPGSADRASQLGPLRAWAAERSDRLRGVLEAGTVLYGEWLYLAHSVTYDRLASYLVGLDLLDGAGTFVSVDERNARCAAVDIATPPEVFRGPVGSVGDLESLLGSSRFGPGPMEGVVVRPLDGGAPRVAKLLSAGFERLDNDDWARGRPRNVLAGRETSWH